MFSLHTVKNPVFSGLKEAIRLGSGQSVQGPGKSPAVSVGLTVLPGNRGREEVKPSAQWRSVQSHGLKQETGWLLRPCHLTSTLAVGRGKRRESWRMILHPTPSYNLIIYLLFLKEIIYLFLDRGEGKEKERERNINARLPFARPALGNLVRNPGMCPEWESNL